MKCIHDSNRKKPLPSKWTQQHSYFQRLLVFSIRACSLPCKQNHHDEWCEREAKDLTLEAPFQSILNFKSAFLLPRRKWQCC